MSPEGKHFGQKLHVQIQVFGKDLLEQAKELMNMGFTDKQKNVELIQAHNGDMSKVVETLLKA